MVTVHKDAFDVYQQMIAGDRRFGGHMGAEKQRKIERGTRRQVLQEFGIDEMRLNLEEMAANVSASANAVANLGKKHDDLVKKCADHAEGTDLDVKRLYGRTDSHQSNLRDLNELRNRGFVGRLKWLLFGW